MVGGKSRFALSARAVEREMVGKDSCAELIGGDAEFRKACSCALLAASSAAAAERASFDLGEVEKKFVSRVRDLEFVLTEKPPFSF